MNAGQNANVSSGPLPRSEAAFWVWMAEVRYRRRRYARSWRALLLSVWEE